MEASQIPRPDPDVIWRVLDGEAVLVSARAGKVRVLNEIGTAIWRLLDGDRSIEDIRRQLLEQFDVPAERVEADLGDFLADLAQKGLLIVSPRP